jgi:hypothetical protein
MVGLLFFDFPIIAVAQWTAWAVVVFVTRKRAWRVGLPLAFGLAILIGWGAVAVRVPIGDPESYAEAGQLDQDGFPYLPDCRPSGLPTWWPSWLPL